MDLDEFIFIQETERQLEENRKRSDNDSNRNDYE